MQKIVFRFGFQRGKVDAVFIVRAQNSTPNQSVAKVAFKILHTVPNSLKEEKKEDKKKKTGKEHQLQPRVEDASSASTYRVSTCISLAPNARSNQARRQKMMLFFFSFFFFFSSSSEIILTISAAHPVHSNSF
jgi:hypothetical protein